MSLPTELLNRFQELVYGQASLRFSPGRLVGLEMKLRERVRVLGLSTYEEYYDLLLKKPAELREFVEGITTKETYFFRLPEQFQVLQQEIIPQVEDRLSQELQGRIGLGPADRLPLRIWSSGCATGEEAYSLTMALLEGLQFPRAWAPEILATDLSREALLSASRGYYDKKTLHKIPADFRAKYVNFTDDGGGVVTEAIRSLVSFRVFNLRDLIQEKGRYCHLVDLAGVQELADFTERFDIIFCRNVMIYFDFPAQQDLVSGLFQCLKPGGYLFTGDAELLHIYQHGFETVERKGTYFYRKP